MGLIKERKYEIKQSVREKKWEVYNGANQRPPADHTCRLAACRFGQYLRLPSHTTDVKARKGLNALSVCKFEFKCTQLRFLLAPTMFMNINDVLCLKIILSFLLPERNSRISPVVFVLVDMRKVMFIFVFYS